MECSSIMGTSHPLLYLNLGAPAFSLPCNAGSGWSLTCLPLCSHGEHDIWSYLPLALEGTCRGMAFLVPPRLPH